MKRWSDWLIALAAGLTVALPSAAALVYWTATRGYGPFAFLLSLPTFPFFLLVSLFDDELSDFTMAVLAAPVAWLFYSGLFYSALRLWRWYRGESPTRTSGPEKTVFFKVAFMGIVGAVSGAVFVIFCFLLFGHATASIIHDLTGIWPTMGSFMLTAVSFGFIAGVGVALRRFGKW